VDADVQVAASLTRLDQVPESQDTAALHGQRSPRRARTRGARDLGRARPRRCVRRREDLGQPMAHALGTSSVPAHRCGAVPGQARYAGGEPGRSTRSSRGRRLPGRRPRRACPLEDDPVAQMRDGLMSWLTNRMVQPARATRGIGESTAAGRTRRRPSASSTMYTSGSRWAKSEKASRTNMPDEYCRTG
jgi:hypothetical protein